MMIAVSREAPGTAASAMAELKLARRQLVAIVVAGRAMHMQVFVAMQVDIRMFARVHVGGFFCARALIVTGHVQILPRMVAHLNFIFMVLSQCRC
jgi:hypothetical protein